MKGQEGGREEIGVVSCHRRVQIVKQYTPPHKLSNNKDYKLLDIGEKMLPSPLPHTNMQKG